MGVTIHKVSEARFCLVFNHCEDLQRVLDLRQWIFYCNLVVLQPLSLAVDPLSMNLDWCPFFVHVNDSPFGQRTVDVVCFIGESLGARLDPDHIAQHIFWFETMRIQVNINASSLKRALKLCSEQGDEVVVRFSYERLPNFCYLCGKLGHIEQFCELRFQDGFIDPGPRTPYASWLWAVGPVRRMGSIFDSVRPMYVWRSSSPAGTFVSTPRGSHIFGDFRCDLGGLRRSSMVVGGGTTVVTRGFGAVSFPPDQLAATHATATVTGRRLVDESSDSDGLLGQATRGIGSVFYSHVGPISPANSGSAQVPDISIGLSVVQAFTCDGPVAVTQASLMPDSGVGHSLDHSSMEKSCSGQSSKSCPLSAPIGSMNFHSSTAEGSDGQLVEVPLGESFSSSSTTRFSVCGGSRGRRGHPRGCGRRGWGGLGLRATIAGHKRQLSSSSQADLVSRPNKRLSF
ncbi:hypothetical protein Salat_1156500 [Sesamum alatum]|uniref:CCHC-type domain-containing protein n=1 Tax=Sesamum alatum TaxID=300844 RepID=A0AAE2CNE1_9LAMI|nr:hypothetical protein Salat_1156500 [Sesamum alatum]